ncbi:MAG: ABC transporter substrate-binding protein [Cyanobacteria bacterium P01_A01_bin.105]
MAVRSHPSSLSYPPTYRLRRLLRQFCALMCVGLMAMALPSCTLAQFRTEAAEPERIVYTILSDPKTFNYALSNERPNIFGLTFEGLIAENYATGEIEPALAESWQFSDDGLTLTYTLREGLQWSDGEPLTVDDVEFTYNQIYLNEEIPTDTRDILRIGDQGLLPTVKAISNRQVEFKIPEPFAPFLRNTGLPIMPQHVFAPTIDTRDMEGKPVFLSTWDTSTPPEQVITNGPYTLKSFLPGERVVFERNPNYWRKNADGSPQTNIEEVIWQVVESQDGEFVQFRSGGLDLMSIAPNNFSLMKQSEAQGGYTVYNAGPAASNLFISFNLNTGDRNGKPLVDPIKSRWFNTLEFRQAVAHAIDRQTMLNDIYQGLGVLQNSPIFFASPYYADPKENDIPTYDYDPEKAKSLLQSAGFTYDGEGQLLDPEGNRVRFTLITNAGNQVRESIGAQIDYDLSRIGMTVDFQPVAWGVMLEKLSDSLDWEAHIISFGGGFEPNGGANVWSVDGGLHVFNQAALPGQEPIENREVRDWETEIDRLYTAGAKELDDEKRKEIYAQTQRITQENLPFIYLVTQYSMSAIRDRIQNLNLSPVGGALWNIHELELIEN